MAADEASNAASGASPPAVDFAYLEGFAAGDLGVVGEVLEIFVEQAQAWRTELAGAGPARAFGDLAHTIKGSALGIGAGPLGAAADAAERGGEAGRHQAAAVLLTTLDAAVVEIGRYLERSRSQTPNS